MIFGENKFTVKPSSQEIVLPDLEFNDLEFQNIFVSQQFAFTFQFTLGYVVRDHFT